MSVLFRQHDGHHEAGFFGIRRVFRMSFQFAIVIIYFRKERLTIVLDADDLNTATNDRGDAVFYFKGSKSITSIEATVTKPQYQTMTSTINIVNGTRNFQKITVTKL